MNTTTIYIHNKIILYTSNKIIIYISNRNTSRIKLISNCQNIPGITRNSISTITCRVHLTRIYNICHLVINKYSPLIIGSNKNFNNNNNNYNNYNNYNSNQINN